MLASEAEALHTALHAGRPRSTLLFLPQFLSLWKHCEHAPEGDFVECGVYKGGAGVLMAKYDRTVWLFDSWEGIPDESGTKYDWKRNEGGKPGGCLAHLSECVDTFTRHGVLRDRLFFVKGWFKDTLPRYSGEIAILRLDGDLYSSTRECLEELYPKVVPGGICIIDDYIFPPCRDAVREYREKHRIKDALYGNDHTWIGGTHSEEVRSRYTGVWWKKS